MSPPPRRPVSVLVVVHTAAGEALLLHRKRPFQFWQSVTGSLQAGESQANAAQRELAEETGLTDEGTLSFSGRSREFVIDSRWRHKFAEGAIENLEYEWHYQLPERVNVSICASEHTDYCWLPLGAASKRVWSWTNREALDELNV